nr:lipopolysaccharide core biosynthesis protein [Klebsiella pneumoniae]
MMRNAGLCTKTSSGHTYRVMVEQYNASLNLSDPRIGTLIPDEEQSMTPETLSRGPLNPARITVIKLRHHGDMLLITPLIHALKQQYPPPAWMSCCMKRPGYARSQPRYPPYLWSRSPLEKAGKRYQLKMQWQLIQTLRQQRYDMVLNRPTSGRARLSAN